MLNMLLFYEEESLSSGDAKLHNDSMLPVYWDPNKGIVISFYYDYDPLRSIWYSHNCNFTRFNDPKKIKEFVKTFKDTFCTMDEFCSNWGTFDFSKIKNCGTSTQVYLRYHVGLLPSYPEFMLDMGEFLEEKIGVVLQNGMGALPVKDPAIFLGNLNGLISHFLSREKYLMGKEILESTKHKSSVVEKTFDYLKKLPSEVSIFNVDTFTHLRSEVNIGDGFAAVIHNIEDNIKIFSVQGHDIKFDSKVFQHTECFLNTYFEIDLLFDDLKDSKIYAWIRLHADALLDHIQTDFYGSGSYAKSLITTDYTYISFEVEERTGKSLVLRLSTTIAID